MWKGRRIKNISPKISEALLTDTYGTILVFYTSRDHNSRRKTQIMMTFSDNGLFLYRLKYYYDLDVDTDRIYFNRKLIIDQPDFMGD
jgi:hypothetical protein